MSEPSHRRGRPPLAEGEPSVDLRCRVPASLYRALAQTADHGRRSVPDTVRLVLQRVIGAGRGDPSLGQTGQNTAAPVSAHGRKTG